MGAVCVILAGIVLIWWYEYQLLKFEWKCRQKDCRHENYKQVGLSKNLDGQWVRQYKCRYCRHRWEE